MGYFSRKNSILTVLLLFVLVPLLLFLSVKFSKGNSYLVSSLIILLGIIPFFISFEKRKPEVKEIMVTAVLCAIIVASRIAFTVFTEVKPFVALIILSGVALGPNTGFLVGAISTFASNFYFSQGLWTPWQMFTFGIIGFLAGLLFSDDKTPTNKIFLHLSASLLGCIVCALFGLGINYIIYKELSVSVIVLIFLIIGIIIGFLISLKRPITKTFLIVLYGAFATLFIAGLFLNLSSAIIWSEELSVEYILTVIIAGIPFDLVHTASTVVFLTLLTVPFTSIIQRIIIKYGLVIN